MSATSETEMEHELVGPAEERDGESVGAAFGPIHLTACIGVGGLFVLAINAIEWLV